jgi:hypothetical protein
MQVVNVGVHGVLQGYPPVDRPIGGPVEQQAVLFEELNWNVFLDGSRFFLSHPDKHHSLQLPGGVGPGTYLSRYPRGGALAEHRQAFALTVEDPAVVGAGNGALVVAVPFGKAGPPVGADVPEGRHLSILIPEEA